MPTFRDADIRYVRYQEAACTNTIAREDDPKALPLETCDIMADLDSALKSNVFDLAAATVGIGHP